MYDILWIENERKIKLKRSGKIFSEGQKTVDIQGTG